jgi:hypothetical protein
MIPLWVILSLYYFVAKIGVTAPEVLRGVKSRNFLGMLSDGLIGTWLGYFPYTIAAWTLAIELFASYFVYILANFVIHYQ